MVKEGNYITVQSFMVNDLQLSGNELLTYALIYGFSQDGNSWFDGSASYIAEWLNISNNSVYALLKKLCDKCLLEKKENIVANVKLCSYRTLLPTQETCYPPKKLVIPAQETCYNIIEDNNIKKEKIDKKEKSYGELGNVKLTEEQYCLLRDKYHNVDVAIEKLDTWLGTTSKKVKKDNHYAYFKANSWVWENLPKEENAPRSKEDIDRENLGRLAEATKRKLEEEMKKKFDNRLFK